MIDAAQVCDLRPGDVVELTSDRWPEGTVVRGPLHDLGGWLYVAGLPVRGDNRMILHPARDTLTVVSRALYANHPRSQPVTGDVVRIEHDGEPTAINVYLPVPGEYRWLSITGSDAGCRYSTDQCIPGRGNDARGRVILLVDGETGRPVVDNDCGQAENPTRERGR